MAGINPKGKEDEKAAAIKKLLSPQSEKPQRKTVRQQLEFNLQCAAHEYMLSQYPLFYCFHIANERKVKKYGCRQIPIEGLKMKQAGVKKGNPDYWILEEFLRDGVQYKGTVIELKAKGKLNNTSPDQKRCIRDLKQRNFFVEVVDNIETFIEIIDKNYSQCKRKLWS